MRILVGAGLAGALVCIPVLPAAANDDRAEVITSGQCSSGARWDLKLKERDGGVEAEFEVDSNVIGQQWAYALTRNGSKVAHGVAITTGPSGSFSVERSVSGSLSDSFAATATFGGQTCDTTGANSPGKSTPGTNTPGDDNPGRDDSRSQRNRTRTTGQCSATSEWKLDLKRRAQSRKVEFEVDSNRSGQSWRYRITHRGTVIAKGTATTVGRSGSMTIKAKVPSTSGVVKARATHAGETCLAKS